MRKIEDQDNTDGSKKVDLDALNTPELLSSVQDRLDNVGGDNAEGDDDPKTDDLHEDDEPTPDGDQAGEGEEGDDSTSEDDSDPEGDDDNKDELKLPEAYLRCAVHQGWEKEDALDFFKREPEHALKTFGNIYNSTNKLSEHWAEFGRTAVDARNKKLEATVHKMASAPGKNVNAEYERVRATADDAKTREIHGFFQSNTMKSYDKFYGVLDCHQEPDDLTASQRKHRWSVMEKADLMITGARMQGRELTAAEALEAAHLLVTEPIREQVIVEKLKATATKRKKGHLFRPSNSRKASGAVGDKNSGKPDSRKEF